jgi:dTDP-4-dehydrorhamnose reductase
MKVLVIGSKGMLGEDMIDELRLNKIFSKGMDIDEIDIVNKKDMQKIIKEKPDVIINCAAYTDVDGAEKERKKAKGVNYEGPGNLARAAKEIGAIIVHISTDYVFNGEKESYDEDEKKDPINFYGLTKSMGEDAIKESTEQYYIIRTSWLFGRKGKNFVETIKRLCNEKEEIKVVDDQKGKPTYTRDLANAIIDLLNSKSEYGIYHLTNSGACTWHEFATEIALLEQSACRIIPCKTEEFPRPAKRPRFSVLKNNKTRQLRHWKEALKEYMCE